MAELDLNLEDLGAFVQVVDSGGFTAAGRVLGRSTKQVSRQVRRLEDVLAVRLLQRTTRAVALTDAGRRFYPHARRVLDDVHSGWNELRAPEARLRGRLRVVLPTLTSVSGLASTLRRLREKYPELALQVSLSDQPHDVIGEGLDLQLTSARPTQQTVLIRRLLTVALPLAAHQDYLARRGEPQTPDDLSTHECLLFISELPQQQWTLVHTDGRSQSVHVAGSMQSDNSSVLFDVLHAGLGIGVCGRAYLEGPGRDAGLVEVLPGWSFEPMPLYAILPRANRQSALVEAFLDEMKDTFVGWLGPDG